MIRARSFLFAPASRPELREKVLASGTDIACLDVEDAVPPSKKDAAREAAAGWIAAPEPKGPMRAVRINPLSTRHGLLDLHVISAAAPEGGLVVLPKVDDAAEIRIADAALTETGSAAALMALIESAAGLRNAFEIASASPRLRLVLFGAADLAAELGAELAPEPQLYARARVVHAARAAGIEAIDVPCLAFRDLHQVAEEARAARRLGFSGKAAIHPTNIAAINEVFSPTDDEVANARRILAAFDDSPTGLAVVDGKLVERPVVRAMRRILALADGAGAGA